MSFKRLLAGQLLFGLAALAFLTASLIWRQTTGAPLSVAPVLPSMAMFLVYLGILDLGRRGYVGWYRIGMIPALLVFGGGGVIGNILRYLEAGLADYASLPVFVIAVGINSFGTLLNLCAALGLFQKDDPL
ncbi:hypothetical protein [Oceanomicrobium pacificus]|uniref:Uncharacterized protein n=1 Tax=Oceanomicrobium pacificus TaxID=2692916 RepID=A0A6B0TSS2_9RHOB|nr:hypothetical protein [Oceanomicrobium pacificus]MXU64314.1 hypothetical protein [Oceanomicrobium pacificus]